MPRFVPPTQGRSVVEKNLTWCFTSGLYHLPNPILFLRATFDNLRAGGNLTLKTQVYDHPQDPKHLLLYAHAEQRCYQLLGIEQQRADEVFGLDRIPGDSPATKVIPAERLAPHMAHAILVARKPEETAAYK
jgi:hypothetical protein